MTTCFAIFGQKRQIFECSYFFSFGVRGIRKNVKRHKIETYTKIAISDFSYFSILTPKFQHFDFFKVIAHKIQNIQDIRKAGMYVIKIHTDNKNAKFQSNILIFGIATDKQKTGEGDDVTFVKSNFRHF